MPSMFSASDEFIVWAQSLSGMLTKIRQRYGSISEMLEHPDWNEDKTGIICRLVHSLYEDMQIIDMEMTNHVNDKIGQELPREDKRSY
jgi:hypothetical protein